MHLDIHAGGGHDSPPEEVRGRVDAEVERLLSNGASVIRVVEERDERWVVMADPESK